MKCLKWPYLLYGQKEGRAIEPNPLPYEVVRESIVNDILRGKYEPGDMIPKQNELAVHFDVSRGTVRKAINELVQRGVLSTVKGVGTFVVDYKQSRRAAQRTSSFSQSKRVKANTLTSKVLEIKEIEAPPWLAKQLEVPVSSTVIVIKRVRLVKGIPENYQISYIARKNVPNIDFSAADLIKGSLFSLLENEANLIISEKDEEIRAVRCPAQVAEELFMNEDDPVILIIRTSYTQTGLPVEYCEDYECTDIKGLKISSRYNQTK